MQVRELMHTQPRTCSRQDSLEHVAQIMWESDVGCVPVVDANGHAAAMITDRDLAMAAYTKGVRLADITVEQVAQRPVISCLPSDAVTHAQHLMSQHQVRRLPVVDEFGKLMGILSQNDLVREASRESRSRHKELSEHEVMQSLAAIGSAHAESVLQRAVA